MKPDDAEILAMVAETRAKIVRGEEVPIEELRRVLEVVRQARAALVGAKPPREKAPKAKTAKVKAQEQDILDQLMGELGDDPGQSV